MDNTASKASGGVRNLRAMFENHDKSEESTPSPQPNRGRSGAPESARAMQSPMTRPLNKVQTNFIAVDKPSKSGTLQWGQTLQNNNNNTTNDTTSSTTTPTKKHEEDTTTTSKKNNIEKPTEDSINNNKEITYTQDTIISPPPESTMPRRRDSFSLHEDLPNDQKSIQARKASIAEEFRNRAQSIQIGYDGAIPEFAVETPALETPAVDGNRARHQLGYSEPPVPNTTANPDKGTNDNQPGVHMNPADPKDESAVTEGKALQGGSIRGLTGGDAKSMREAAVQGLKATPAKAALAMRGAPSSATNSPAATSSSAKKPLRSPPLERTPVSAAAGLRNATASSRNVSNASASSSATAKSSTANGAPKPATSSTARSSATAPTASQTAKKVPSGTSATSGTGFHKPKPKSPTRPAKLPSSLTAPTASSISKVAGAENSTTTQKRRESHGSLARSASTKLRGETLKHTTSHGRPSVGPPPSSAAQKKAATTSSKPAGDSFLERMMRPTAASANKAVGSHDDKEKSNSLPPKATKPTTSVVSQTSKPVTREKVQTDKEKPQAGPSKLQEKREEQQEVEEQKEKVEEQKKGEITPPDFERPTSVEKTLEAVSPKTEAPPLLDSKANAIKTEVPSTHQEPHVDSPKAHHEPHVEPPKASTPSGVPNSHVIKPVQKTERTVSITDMEHSDGTFKKLKPGEIPIPKIAKKKKPQPVAVEENKKVATPPRSPKPAVTDLPKEKKRDFLLEVREEEKRHRRMSERPSLVKNPTSIPEVAEPEDEEIDDHQLPSGSSGDDADVSSMEVPRTVPKNAPSPQKEVSPPKDTAPKHHRDSIEQNAIESEMMDAEDVDDVDITADKPSEDDKAAIKTRRLSTTAEKAMDYAAEAVDQAAAAVDEALANKMSAAQKAEAANAEEAEAVDDLSKGHPLTSAMLNGSALDTDDEYTPSPAEKTNPFDDKALGIEGGEKKERKPTNAGDFDIEPAMKEGEQKMADERRDEGGESKLKEGEEEMPIEEETAKEGEKWDKVEDTDVTALAS